MSSKRKNPSVFDRVREELRRLLDDLGPLLRPGKLQPKHLPARHRKPARKR